RACSRTTAGAAGHGGQEVQRVWRPCGDPQGRLRLLHAVRPPGDVRVSTRPVIPVRQVSGKPSPQALASLDRRWRWQYVMLAPHRLGSVLARVVLVASGGWWAVVQLARSTGWWGMYYALSPTVVHSAVMGLGFIPLFFAGFLFTAGPKWLGVDPLPPGVLQWPLLAQAAGWLLWLVGAHWRIGAALAGLALGCAGLVWMTAL